jgi:hypothetical protein
MQLDYVGRLEGSGHSDSGGGDGDQLLQPAYIMQAYFSIVTSSLKMEAGCFSKNVGIHLKYYMVLQKKRTKVWIFTYS